MRPQQHKCVTADASYILQWKNIANCLPDTTVNLNQNYSILFQLY